MSRPLVAAVTMGLGHLRAAAALADQLGVPVAEVDRAPFAEPWEEAVWRRSRLGYEWLSRAGEGALLGPSVRLALARMTSIPSLDGAESGAGRWAASLLERQIRRGLGARLARQLDSEGRPLVSTFYAPALAVEHHGEVPVACVATDTDLHRVWAGRGAVRSRVLYLAPTNEAAARLTSHGVGAERVVVTGFPLPGELLGGEGLPALRATAAARLARLDPRGAFLRDHRREVESRLGFAADPVGAQPPRLVFAVGGAGALTATARHLLRCLAPALREGRLRLALVAGMRSEVARRFASFIAAERLDDLPGEVLELLHEPETARYFSRFNQLLARSDLLWSKPSELVFFAGLGLPLLLDRPVGDHEACNRRWLLARGAGFDCPPAGPAASWLAERLADGSLARVAWRGFTSVPNRGLYRTAEVLAHRGFTAA